MYDLTRMESFNDVRIWIEGAHPTDVFSRKIVAYPTPIRAEEELRPGLAHLHRRLKV